MNAELRLKKDGIVVEDWTENLDRDSDKALAAALRSALVARRVNVDDADQVARYSLQVKRHLGWHTHRGIR